MSKDIQSRIAAAITIAAMLSLVSGGDDPVEYHKGTLYGLLLTAPDGG